MKWIEDILKAKLSGSKAKADPALDNALWDKIAAGLNDVPSDGVATYGHRRLKQVTAAAGLFVLLGIGYGLMRNEGGALDTTNPQAGEKQPRTISSEPQAALIDHGVGGISDSESLQEASMPDERIADEAEAQGTSFPEQRSESDQTQQTERPTGSDSWSSTGSPPMPSASVTIQVVPEDDAMHSSSVAELTRRTNEPDAEPSDPAVPLLFLVPMPPLSGPNWVHAALAGDARAGSHKPRYFAIRAYGGMTVSDFHYQNENLAIFSDHFYAASSAFSGVAFDFEFRRHQWSVGLGWSDFAQRLEFEHTWQSEYVDPHGIVAVEMDAVSGDTLSVQTGPVLVTASHHRQVRDYNHWNAMVIPVEWRKEWLVSQWTFGAALGGQLLIRTGGRGQSFVDEGTLAAFGDADLSRSRITWSPSLRVYTGYQFEPEWRLDLSLAAGAQSVGSRSNEDLTGSVLTAWEGQLRTFQIAAGVTRFFELLRSPAVK